MINSRKLLHRHRVEVRQLEEGLRGSWHSGVVVGVSDSCRDVRYDELLCESGISKLIESIPVTGAIEGLYQRPCVKSNYRGRIRPVPPHSEAFNVNLGLKFGVCVDVLFEEAWWEGVIVDCDEDAKERRVYCPDEGDARLYSLSDIRLTLDWDEFSGSWRERGTWLLVNLIMESKTDGNLFQLIRRVWSRLKVHYGYQKMISEWTCGAYSVWKEYFREVIRDATVTPKLKTLTFPTGSHRHVTKKRGCKSRKGKYLNASVLTRSMRKRKDKDVSLAVRTRRMCMSESENLPVAAAPSGRHFSCTSSHSTAEDSCVITDSPRADSRGGCDQIGSVGCVHTSDCSTEKGEFRHERTTQTRSLYTPSPCCYTSDSKMPVKSCFRREWQFDEKCLKPKKVKPSKIISRQSKNQSCDGSKITRQMGNHVSIQVFDHKSFDRRKGLMQTQKKVGFTVRYSVVRQGGNRRIPRRNIKQKRSSLRIKKIPPRKLEEDSDLKPASLENLEEPNSSREEDNVIGSQRDSTIPATVSCQELGSEDALNNPNKLRAGRRRCFDSVCFICQYGDELHHCDVCMCSYHFRCVDPEAASSGELSCPSCRCGLCGLKDCVADDQTVSDVCYQCSRQYHLACLDQAGISVSEDIRFCSKNCFEICARLHQLLRASNPTSVEGLTWSITRSRRNDCNVYNERVHPLIQVSQVLNVFHECFKPITEPHSGRDLVADIVYNSGSKFKRLDFHGFYVMAVVNAAEVVCAATIRIHGQKVAEMPLIATPFKYRRQGMCRMLLRELEKMLAELGVERLVLPGIASLSETWVSSFGFTEMPASVRRELLGYPFVGFQGTTLFQKILFRSTEVPDNAELSCTPEIIIVNECTASPFDKCDVQQIEVLDNAEPGTPEIIKANECAASPSDKCDVQQIEVLDNAELCTPEIIMANECAASPSDKCDVQQIEVLDNAEPCTPEIITASECANPSDKCDVQQIEDNAELCTPEIIMANECAASPSDKCDVQQIEVLDNAEPCTPEIITANECANPSDKCDVQQIEVLDNAELCTPEIIMANECAASPSDKCDVQQIEVLDNAEPCAPEIITANECANPSDKCDVQQIEVSDNAEPCTPEIIMANECAASHSDRCDVQQTDCSHWTGRFLRPIKQTYFRKHWLNRNLQNPESLVDYEGSSQELMKLDKAQLVCSQENCLKNEHQRFSVCYTRKRSRLSLQEKCLKNEHRMFSLCYRRKRRRIEACDGKTAVIDGFDKKQPTLKYVYQRRRIQASRNPTECFSL